MAALFLVFKILLHVAIVLAAFGTGLRVARVGRIWPFCAPGLFWRSMLAILVLVPLAALALLEVLRPPPIVRVGLTISILAVGIGPPAAFRRASAAGPVLGYDLGLNLSLLAASVVFIPLSVWLHGLAFGHHVHLAVLDVARVVLLSALIPMAAGAAVARWSAPRAERLGRYVAPAAKVMFSVLVPVVLLLIGPSLVRTGAAAWLISALVAAVAVVIGHLMGGPDPELRGELAAYSAIRFPALALLIAAAAGAEKRLLPVVLIYVVTSSVVVGLYGALRKALQQRIVARRARAPG